MEYVTPALLHLTILAELGISAEMQRAVVQQAWEYSAEQFRDAVRAATAT